MADPEKLLAEFKDIRKKYQELYTELAKLGNRGVIDPIDLVAAKCSAGDACHGGSNDAAFDTIINPGARTRIDPSKK